MSYICSMKISKEIRLRVWNKYNKKCAYCGIELPYNKMQVDHIDPYFHNINEDHCNRINLKKGKHEEDNFNPSCARCNRRKDSMTIEIFREEISKQCERLKRDSNQYKLALDYGMIIETNIPIVFWFERFDK